MASQQELDIRRALNARRIAVVGMSPKPERAGHYVAAYLIEHGYDVVPVNPREDEILGLKCYPSLAAVPGKVDLVDVFREASAVPEIAAQTVAIKAEFLWLQLGIVSEEGAAIARQGGVTCIMDKCIKVEHARYL